MDAVSYGSAMPRAAGVTLARLHAAAKGFDAPARTARPLVGSFSIFSAEDASDSMERYLAMRPALDSNAETRRDCAEALNLLAPLHEELRPLLTRLDPLWTHNDLHASNLFWSSKRDDAHATAVIDFGLADRTFAVHDLAVAIERNVVEWLRLGDSAMPVHLDHLFAAAGRLRGCETTVARRGCCTGADGGAVSCGVCADGSRLFSGCAACAGESTRGGK